ncbi:putative LPS assembly protein LptD [Xanthovirga aplysinae]|uniref:putative LPS assembly protein LptD n=1 Tax=Xanthovirga aplysinae TaxID=2529853 RepID=UPI0012BC08D2|nr:putative LPS assembly protein LptD [Xanthovirga aplysinae]MTI32605.1 LPS-assembly protein LptD [Xanthovirga aplysinae]
MKQAFLLLLTLFFLADLEAQDLNSRPKQKNLHALPDSLLLKGAVEPVHSIPNTFEITQEKSTNLADKLATDSLSQENVLSDTLTVESQEDTVQVYSEGSKDIESSIDYTAADSTTFDMVNQLVYLWGNAKVNYGDIKLEADFIKINMKDNTVEANGRVDSLGTKIGFPVFTQSGQTYEADSMSYNFETDKAVIRGVVTQDGEGYIQGKDIVKNDQGDAFIHNAIYTTCNLKEPHFHIAAKKIKRLDNGNIVTGPFNLHFNNVPTPIGFGFGMFPAPQSNASGIVVPSYGEETRRGFFLKDGGYYFHINDYINLTLLGSIYSQGSNELKLSSSYKKRYKYNGNFNISYSKLVPREESILDDSYSQTFWVTWSHQPESRGNSRFSANVNFGSSSYNEVNAQSISDRINSTFSSNVQYSKTFQGTPFNLAISGRHNQNVRDSTVNLTLPELSFNMSTVYPFRSQNSSGNKWYEKINVSYGLTAKNEITNQARNNTFDDINVINASPEDSERVPFDLDHMGTILNRAQYGMQHRIPVQMSMNVLKHFTITPNINYNETWYDKHLEYEWDEQANGVRIDTVRSLSRTGSWDAGASLNTRMYGTYYFKKGKVKAIRHTMVPSVSYSYTPETGQDIFQDVQINEDGDTRRLSKYEGFLYGGTTGMERSTMNFSISNTLEMKVEDKNDTTGVGTKNVNLLDNFSISSGYDFLRDSLNLNNISLSARTRLFNNKLDVSINATLDPYAFVLDSTYTDSNGLEQIAQRQINEYAWNFGQGLGNLQSINLSLGTSLNPKSINDIFNPNSNPETNATEDQLDEIRANPDRYIDWSVPWNLRVNYNLNYRKDGFKKSDITQSLTFSGDVSITEKWKIGFSSGYDFEKKALVENTTRLNISRDLHCWDLQFDWTPLGQYQSFSLYIAVKASILQDLKLSRRRTFWDN